MIANLRTLWFERDEYDETKKLGLVSKSAVPYIGERYDDV